MSRDLADTTLVMDLPDAPRQAPASERLGMLTLLNGAAAGVSHTLASGELGLGRDPEADIVLDDERSSRRHARLLRTGDGYFVEDLGSTNGTWVDAVRVQGRHPLHDGARLRVGATLLRFDLRDAVEQDAARRVYESSVRDGLTGLYNRRHFDERLASEFAFAVRHKSPLCLMLLDIDHFKKINDTYGHPAGDAVLRAVAEALVAALREEDFVARYGGEEIVILTRGIDADGAHRLAERARRIVEGLRIATEQGELRCQVSVGYAHNQIGPPPAGRDALVATADAALYRAKQKGRNRVEPPSTVGQYFITQPRTGGSGSRGGERSEDRGQARARRRVWDAKTGPLED